LLKAVYAFNAYAEACISMIEIHLVRNPTCARLQIFSRYRYNSVAVVRSHYNST